MLQNRIYRGEIVHKEQSHPGEHTSIIDQSLWDAAQAQLAGNAAERNSSARHRQPSLLAGLLFDGDGNRMTPSHAVKKGTRYRYYVSAAAGVCDRQADGRTVPSPVRRGRCFRGPANAYCDSADPGTDRLGSVGHQIDDHLMQLTRIAEERRNVGDLFHDLDRRGQARSQHPQSHECSRPRSSIQRRSAAPTETNASPRL
jgi:hypothetical protein